MGLFIRVYVPRGEIYEYMANVSIRQKIYSSNNNVGQIINELVASDVALILGGDA